MGIVYCTCGHFLQKERAVNRTFEIHDGLSFTPSVCYQEGKPHGHRCGKSQETKNIGQPIEEMQKEKVQGIDDGFLRDHEFRIRMIEHHRDEEVCRRWDALAYEDHTHLVRTKILLLQEQMVVSFK